MDLSGHVSFDTAKYNQPGAVDIALDLGKSIVQSAVVSPLWNGVGQLVSGGRLPQISITNEENGKHSAADAWAQKIGGAVGMAVDLWVLSRVSKGVFGAAAEGTTMRSMNVSEKALLRLGEGLRVGAAYGAAFVPSAPGDNILAGRLKNAATSGITFGAMAGLSEAAGSIGVLGKMRPGTLAHVIKDMAVTGAVGLPSGAIGAEADSLLNHGQAASWRSIKGQATDYAVIGLVFSGLTHGAAGLSVRPAVALPGETHGTASWTLLDSPAGTIGGPEHGNQSVVAEHGLGGTKIKVLSDGTRITEDGEAVETEHPDGSVERVSSFGVHRLSTSGEWSPELNHWAKAYDNWDKITTEEKRVVLETIDQIPPRGRLQSYLVGKGFSESDPALQQLALKGIRHIQDVEDLAREWGLSYSFNKTLRPDLINMIPDLAFDARQRLLSGRWPEIGCIFTALCERGNARGVAHPEVQATTEYLNMVQGFTKIVRRNIWDQLIEAVGPAKIRFPYAVYDLEPLARLVMNAMKAKDPLALKVFEEVITLPQEHFNVLDKIQTDKPSRDDIVVKAPKGTAAALKQMQGLLLGAENTPDPEAKAQAIGAAREQVDKLLEASGDMGLKKRIADWGRAQSVGWIREYIDQRMSSQRLYRDLILAFHDPEPALSKHDFDKVTNSTFALSTRRSENHVTFEQLAATLQNSVQLLEIANANRGQSGRLTRVGNQFRVAALQTMVQAADPFIVVQGRHPTCALGQLEVSTFLKHPDEASRLINEVMRTGKFVAQDGTIISIDAGSLKPEAGSLQINRTLVEDPDASYRSYVSQLFQTTAANIYWQRQTIFPDGSGRQIPLGSLRYEMRYKDIVDENKNIVGQRPHDVLVDYSRKRPRIIANGPTITHLNQLVDIGEQIGGPRTRPSVTMSLPKTSRQFSNYLNGMAYPENFPLILPIDADALEDPSRPFKQGNHAISILAPWQPGKSIFYHNTWAPGGLLDQCLNIKRLWQIARH